MLATITGANQEEYSPAVNRQSKIYQGSLFLERLSVNINYMPEQPQPKQQLAIIARTRKVQIQLRKQAKLHRFYADSLPQNNFYHLKH